MGNLALRCDGQMAVELAALLPVVLVVALIAFNLMRFLCACARFDRVAPDAVVSQGVSPAGEQSESNSTSMVAECIRESMGDACEVEVRAEPVALVGDGTTFTIDSSLTRYVCTMRLRPWPASFSIAGVSLGPPACLEHSRSVVVDRFKSGVVV